jgi:galactonate dehydratase
MVVLYVYTIQQRHAPEEKYRKYFEAAAMCQSQISALAERNSLAERYSVVLEELRLEAVKQVQHLPEAQKGNADLRIQSGHTAPEVVMHESHASTTSPSGHNGVQELGEIFSTSNATIFEEQSDTTPSSLVRTIGSPILHVRCQTPFARTY